MRWLTVLVASMMGCNAASTPIVTVEAATCDAPIGGPFAFPDSAEEGAVGYDEAFWAFDPTTLPPSVDTTALRPLDRTLVAFALERRRDELPRAFDRDALLAEGLMGRAVLFAFGMARQEGGEGIDRVALRRGLHRFYACTRRAPTTWTGFRKAVYDPDALTATFVSSPAKNETRRLRSDPEAGVWVAETIVEGEVRETEVILTGHRADGRPDFLVYDADGRLSDRSRFETPEGVDISGAAPYVCVICHSTGPDFAGDTLRPF